MLQNVNIIPQVQQNIDPSARLLHLGDVHRTGIHGRSVSPSCSIQEGLVLRDPVSDSIYALTQRNRIVTGFFVVLATAQTIFSMVFLASPDNAGKLSEPTSCALGVLTMPPPIPIVLQLPDIKLDPFYVCSFTTNAKLGSAYTSLSLVFDFCAFITVVVSAYTSLSLVFDFCAFITVVVSAYKSMPASLARDFMFTGVIGAVVQGATIYFALVFTSQFVLTMFVLFGRVCLIAISFGICDCFLYTMRLLLMTTGKLEVGDRTVSWFRMHPRVICQ